MHRNLKTLIHSGIISGGIATTVIGLEKFSHYFKPYTELSLKKNSYVGMYDYLKDVEQKMLGSKDGLGGGASSDVMDTSWIINWAKGMTTGSWAKDWYGVYRVGDSCVHVVENGKDILLKCYQNAHEAAYALRYIADDISPKIAELSDQVQDELGSVIIMGVIVATGLGLIGSSAFGLYKNIKNHNKVE